MLTESDFQSVSESIERNLVFSLDGAGVKATAQTITGRQCVSEAMHAQKTIAEAGILAERSILFLTASVAEIFAGRLIKIHLLANLGTMDDINISVSDLQSVDTIEDAIDHAADSKVESILRQSASGWLEQLLNYLSVSAEHISDRRDALVEAYARRNAIIHNDGIIGKQYFSLCNNYCDSNNLQKGDVLTLDYGYLNSSLDAIIAVLGFAGYAYLAKLDKLSDPRRFHIINQQSINEIGRNRFDLAIDLCKLIEHDPKTTDADKLIARINRLQSLKWQGNNEDCLNEVDKIDWSTREDKFKLARAVLADEFDEAKILAAKCIKVESISIHDLMTWPLFRQCRERRVFDDIISSSSDSASQSYDIQTDVPASDKPGAPDLP